jgi:acyl-CoA thioester hydrolase
MKDLIEVLRLRVRYSETDQMGTFYNSRALEWFECARTELMRGLGFAYAEMERRGVFLPLVESHVLYQGRAHYDDLLIIQAKWSYVGRARMRFDVRITQSETGRPVAEGYTIQAFVDATGKVIRPPAWLVETMDKLPDPSNKPDLPPTKA